MSRVISKIVVSEIEAIHNALQVGGGDQYVISKIVVSEIEAIHNASA